MNIGIIGAGALGSNAARLLVKSGVSATIANSRGPQSLSRLVGELGPSVNAKAEVRKLLERTGYFPVDLGVLDVGGALASPPFGSLAAINFVKL